MKNLGDKIAAIPVVHWIGNLTGCNDPVTGRPYPESPCGQAITRLNAGDSLADVFYDRFWKPTEERK